MFSSIYAGLSGLISFAKGLDVISHNVANLNTPGFKSSQLFFEDLTNQMRFIDSRQTIQLGAGVTTSQSRMKFAQGEIRETRNPLDAAIDGNGFFVLRNGDKTFYTRNGQFDVDVDGYLVDKGSQARVAALVGGALADINLNGHRVNPPVATTEIKFIGNLSSGSQEKELSNVSVIDANGTNHQVTIKFTNNASVKPGSWIVKIFNAANQELSSGEIEFNGNGSIKRDKNTLLFRLNASDTDPIVLYFGDPDGFTGATHFSAGSNSDIRVNSQNGRSTGFVTKITFDEEGRVVVSFSNAQTVKLDPLALAAFEDPQQLEQLGSSLFVARNAVPARLSISGQDGLGKIQSEKIELSNVELTEQFTDLIIVQRGYQASSQAISVGNEMIQQLMDLKARR